MFPSTTSWRSVFALNHGPKGPWQRNDRVSSSRRFRSARRFAVESLEQRDLLAVFTVSSPLDGVAGDLRSAVLAANATPGPDVIEFNVSNIQLLFGEIVISDDVHLSGSTAPGGAVDVHAAPNSRIFTVDDAQPVQRSVLIDRLTFRNGNVVSTGSIGGAIVNHEHLTLRESTITGNTAFSGGGIANLSGRVTMHQSIVDSNTAYNDGGGIMNIGGGILELYASQVLGNTVTSFPGSGGSTFGGGIQNIGQSTARLVNSTVLGNSAVVNVPGAIGSGGGISNMLESLVHLIDSNVLENHADHHGGGIFSVDNSSVITEQTSEVFANTAGEAGGGLYLKRGNADLIDTTVTFNLTDDRGGGISAGIDVTLNILNSQITDNRTDLIAPSGSGGGIYLSGFGTANGPRVTISGSAVLRNNLSSSAPHGGDFGGGISVRYGVDLDIVQSEISMNGANQSGGGIYASDRFTAYAPQITIADSLIVDNVADIFGGGGMTMAGGNLEISNSHIRANTTNGRGGGLFLAGLGSPLSLVTEVRDSHISGNHAGIEGGGIAAGPAVNLQVIESHISNNSTFGKGGGLYSTALGLPSFPNDTVITRSVISENKAVQDPSTPITSYASGGGIWIGPAASIGMHATTVSANNADRFGGGLVVNQGNFDVRNSTFSHNGSGLDGGGALLVESDGLLEQNTFYGNRTAFNGGGIALRSFSQNQVTIAHNTIVANQADMLLGGAGRGGGIFVSDDPANNIQIELRNSVVAKNFSGSILQLPHNDDLFDGPTLLGGAPVVATNNLIGSEAGNLLNPAFPDPQGNYVGDATAPLDPVLGPLTNNGGPTHTMLPQSGSPLINSGDPLFVSPPILDQRELARVSGGRLDIGSVEVQSTFSHPDLNNDGLVNIVDIDLLTQAIAMGSYVPGYDMNGDGALDIVDIERWLCKAGNINLGPGLSYRFGDANLDGVVDGADFALWNANKFTQNGNWSNGNFNGDAAVDGQDLNLWNMNKFNSSPVLCNPVPSPMPGGCQLPFEPIAFVADPDGLTDIATEARKRPTIMDQPLSIALNPASVVPSVDSDVKRWNSPRGKKFAWNS